MGIGIGNRRGKGKERKGHCTWKGWEDIGLLGFWRVWLGATIGVWGVRYVGRFLLGCRQCVGKLLPFELPFCTTFLCYLLAVGLFARFRTVG